MDRFVVEANRKIVGIAIRVPGGYKFVCSDADFRTMDRKVFPRAKSLANSIAKLARSRCASSALLLH